MPARAVRYITGPGLIGKAEAARGAADEQQAEASTAALLRAAKAVDLDTEYDPDAEEGSEQGSAAPKGLMLWPDGPLVLGAKAAAEQRAQGYKGDRRAFSSDLARLDDFRANWRHEPVRVNGKAFEQLDGYASVVEIEYEMWDYFGPYTEKVAAGAFDATLSAQPDVTFLVNHKGLSMARTKAPAGMDPTLILDADPRGLHSLSYMNPERNDVHDLLLSIDDGVVTEMSFAFMINDGAWSDDFETYTIKEVDIDRGDVSAVNFGANPYTSITARSQEFMSSLEHLPPGAQRAAFGRLAEILGGGPQAVVALTRSAQAVAKDAPPEGRSVAYYESLLELDV